MITAMTASCDLLAFYSLCEWCEIINSTLVSSKSANWWKSVGRLLKWKLISRTAQRKFVDTSDKIFMEFLHYWLIDFHFERAVEVHFPQSQPALDTYTIKFEYFGNVFVFISTFPFSSSRLLFRSLSKSHHGMYVPKFPCSFIYGFTLCINLPPPFFVG